MANARRSPPRREDPPRLISRSRQHQRPNFSATREDYSESYRMNIPTSRHE